MQKHFWRQCQWPESSALDNAADFCLATLPMALPPKIFCLKLPNSVRNAKKNLEAMPTKSLQHCHDQMIRAIDGQMPVICHRDVGSFSTLVFGYANSRFGCQLSKMMCWKWNLLMNTVFWRVSLEIATLTHHLLTQAYLQTHCTKVHTYMYRGFIRKRRYNYTILLF